MIYFAYGSNIDPFQMRPRCRGAEIRGAGLLDGYRLCFPRYSFVRQSAVASIEEGPDAVVWGALYEIAESGLARLDACEGFHLVQRPGDNAFYRIEVEPRSREGETIKAFTYRANPMAYAGAPSYDYLAQIVRGATPLGIPDDYLQMLLTWRPPEEAAA